MATRAAVAGLLLTICIAVAACGDFDGDANAALDDAITSVNTAAAALDYPEVERRERPASEGTDFQYRNTRWEGAVTVVLQGPTPGDDPANLTQLLTRLDQNGITVTNKGCNARDAEALITTQTGQEISLVVLRGSGTVTLSVLIDHDHNPYAPDPPGRFGTDPCWP